MREEERQYVRWKEKIQVSYAPGEVSHGFKEVFTENISELGLLIRAFEELGVDQKVQLKLEFVYDSICLKLSN